MTPKLRTKVIARDAATAIAQSKPFSCPLCGFEFVLGVVDPNIEVDHVTPKCVGGSDHETNLQSVCWSCNRSKRGHAQPNLSREDIARIVICHCGKKFFVHDEAYRTNITLVMSHTLPCKNCGGKYHKPVEGMSPRFSKATKKSMSDLP